MVGTFGLERRLVRPGPTSSTIQHQLTLLLVVDDGWLNGCCQCLLIRLMIMLISTVDVTIVIRAKRVVLMNITIVSRA